MLEELQVSSQFVIFLLIFVYGAFCCTENWEFKSFIDFFFFYGSGSCDIVREAVYTSRVWISSHFITFTPFMVKVR